MALTTQLAVEQKLQWNITAEPDSTVTALIADAQAHIEAEVGRPLESAARVETLDGDYWDLFLKNFPVTDVTAVTEDGTVLTVADDVLWYERGKIIRAANGRQIRWRTTKPQSIVVEYDGGYLAGTHDSQLEHLGSICAEVVARAFRKGAENAALPAGSAGAVQSVSLEGSDSVTYATGGGDSATGGGLNQFIFLLEDERRQLLRYRGAPRGIA